MGIAVVAGVADAFAPAPQSAASSSALSMSLEKYSDELKATSAAMVEEGKGLLACDESTGTVGARLESIGLENNEDNRREWRQLLFTTPNIGDKISGAILFEETLYQDSKEGKPFVDLLNEAGIIPGIKVDTGLKPLCGAGDGETWCSGLDDSTTSAFFTMPRVLDLPSGVPPFASISPRISPPTTPLTKPHTDSPVTLASVKKQVLSPLLNPKS